jgi:integrase/recombinase XerC/integrase/recombinase XerD
MMTLDTISIRSDNRHGYPPPHDRPERTVPLTAKQTICPPGLEEFLGRLSEKNLFGKKLIRRYFAYLYRRRLSKSTIKSYEATLFAFITFLMANGRCHIETIVRDDIGAYVEQEQDRGMSLTTVNTRIRAIYAFLQFLADREIIHPKVLNRKIRIKLPDTLPRAIDPEDIRCLLKVIGNRRDRALILTLLRSGMRIGELLNTKRIDINLAEKRIDIFEAQKNRVGRVVYISNDALTALKRWLKAKKSTSDYIFSGHGGRPLSYEASRIVFIKYLRKAGLTHKGYTLHTLRHTFASELLNAGMRLECLQQLLGHSSIEMTRRYARLTDNTRRDEYFKAMQIIEKEGIGGHYRRDHSIPAVY